MRRLLLIFAIFNFSGCGLVSTSKNETKAVQAVANFYGGFCEPTIGVSASTETGNKKFFELKVTESNALEQFKNSPEIAASNVAYLFYTHLKEEKNQYSEIRSQLVFKDADAYIASYPSADLALIESKLKLVEQLTYLLKSNMFHAISLMLSDQSFAEEEKAKLINSIAALEPQLGVLKDYTILGFKKSSYNDFNVLDVFVVVDRAKEKTQLNVKIDLKPNEDKIHFLDYKFEL
ncbi:hypothetical protein [Desertivirga arenae]|uniref:hypothetical protein n=1 Tax=Desertivirga arenae TaxID=2810309 RepID=UPI001A95AE0C|nr:hypothetical protein [Pedobacter sp. SYSU D00823]